MASLRWLLAALAFVCLIALSRQECVCESTLEKAELENGIKCDGNSDAVTCLETCKDQQPVFKNFLRQLKVFEKAACNDKVEKEAKGECWKSFFEQCKNIVPATKEEETEKICTEKKAYAENCQLKAEHCQDMRKKVTETIVEMCGKPDNGAALLRHTYFTLVLAAVAVLFVSQW